MNFLSREAQESDFATVQRIVDANQKALNPDEISFGEMEAKELLQGFFDPSINRLLKVNENDEWECLISLHPDLDRERFYLDIYRTPSSSLLPIALGMAIDLAREANPTFRLWPGVHSADSYYQDLLAQRGFKVLRRYWLMQMKLGLPSPISLPEGAELIEVGSDEQLLFEMWQIHQDSFSEHFGFMPRTFESWSKKVIQDSQEKNQKAWILRMNGEGVGFVDWDDSLLHEDSGYVAGLGVRKAYQGRGLGEILLRYAIKENTEAGREKLALNVDAGNESGALRLYEKVGMSISSEWHQYENPNWATSQDRS